MANGYPKPPRVLFSPSGSPNSAPSGTPSLMASSGGGTNVPNSAPVSSFYATVNLDGRIQIFYIANEGTPLQGNLLRTFPDPKAVPLGSTEIPPVTDIIFSPDSRFLSWGRADGTIALYNIQENSLIMIVDSPNKSEC